VRFGKADRKIERMRPYLQAQAATGRSGVAAIGVAQEFLRCGLIPRHCPLEIQMRLAARITAP
jgi:hypothetical protein